MKNHKKIFLIIVLIVLLGGVFAYSKLSEGSTSKKTGASRNDRSVNYDAPSDEQKNAAGTNESKENSQNKPIKAGDGTSKQGVGVLITTWAAKDGYMNVNARVDDLVEDGGICTLTLTRNGVTRTTSRKAEPNVTDTSCGKNSISLDGLTPGTWIAVIGYESSTSIGRSEPVAVEVPND